VPNLGRSSQLDLAFQLTSIVAVALQMPAARTHLRSLTVFIV
jgi:hypothetical protein